MKTFLAQDKSLACVHIEALISTNNICRGEMLVGSFIFWGILHFRKSKSPQEDSGGVQPVENIQMFHLKKTKQQYKSKDNCLFVKPQQTSMIGHLLLAWEDNHN